MQEFLWLWNWNISFHKSTVALQPENMTVTAKSAQLFLYNCPCSKKNFQFFYDRQSNKHYCKCSETS
jgi:hypothetical protein